MYDTDIGLVLSGGGARGAYEVGVLRAFAELGISPGRVAGTSVGAINAAFYASCTKIEKIISAWEGIHRSKIYRINFSKSIKGFFQPEVTSLLDHAPLKKWLSSEINWDLLGKNGIHISITAVNAHTGNLKIFHNDQVTPDSILASCSMPILFPWTVVENDPYWDGGLMANTPIHPLLPHCSTIFVVLLPANLKPKKFPKNKKVALELVFNFIQRGSFQVIFSALEKKQIAENAWELTGSFAGKKIIVLEPKIPLRLFSIFDFSSSSAKKLIQYGYQESIESLSRLCGILNI